jgi:regulator of CtrA degradation
MSVGSSVSSRSAGGVTVSFAEHFTVSSQFDDIYREGMALVERAASYLDGPGRREAKLLKSPLTLLYATESMRLTTRLLEVASWLLLRRALRNGEIDAEEARMKRRRIRLTTIGRPSHTAGFGELPQSFRDLVEASFAMNDRIVQLDRALEQRDVTDVGETNPVRQQVARIEHAFAAPSLNKC